MIYDFRAVSAAVWLWKCMNSTIIIVVAVAVAAVIAVAVVDNDQ